MMARPRQAKPAAREYVTRTYRLTPRQDVGLHAALMAARMGELRGVQPGDGLEDLSCVVRAAVDEWLVAHVPPKILRAFQPGAVLPPGRGRPRRLRLSEAASAASGPGVAAEDPAAPLESKLEEGMTEESALVEGVGDAR